MIVLKYDIILHDLTVKNDYKFISKFLIYKLFSNILYTTKNNLKSVRLCLLT